MEIIIILVIEICIIGLLVMISRKRRIRKKIEKAEKSGFTTDSKDDILKESKKRYEESNNYK